MEKRRKIFDDGATIVEEVSVKSKKKPELNVEDDNTTNSRNAVRKVVKVEDVLSAFAGYLPTQVNFMPRDDEGECVICGSKTSSSMRTICFPCLQKNGEKLYLEAKKSIEIDKNSFDF